MAVRIALLDDYQHVALSLGNWSALPDAEVVAFADHLDDPDSLVARLSGFDVVVAMRERTPLPGHVLARLPDLKLLVTTGMGNAVIDMGAAAAAGITVCGTSGNITSTVELTWGLILSLLRHIPLEDGNIRKGGWQLTVGTGIAGRRLGLVGLGNIGTLVARVGQAFGMEVVAWSRHLTAERANGAGVTAVSKEELFAGSDVISVHYVLSDVSRGIIGRDDLSRMKPSAVLVNTSRGPLVDEGALVEALEQRWIAGAGVDVFEPEPLAADHPLRRLPNTVVTPHLGYVTDDCYRIFYDHIVEDIALWLKGDPVRVIATPQGGPSH
jgi:phosphoglycerate dehydrogenase-like enzyme